MDELDLLDADVYTQEGRPIGKVCGRSRFAGKTELYIEIDEYKLKTIINGYYHEQDIEFSDDESGPTYYVVCHACGLYYREFKQCPKCGSEARGRVLD